VTDADTQSKLAECQDMIRLLTAKLTEVAAERDRLRAEKSDALSVCQELYSDPTAPPALRLKAAGLALQFEVPRLLPEKAALELQAEPVEDLATLVERQRRRADAMQREMRDIEVSPSGVVRILPKPGGGNGSDDTGG